MLPSSTRFIKESIWVLTHVYGFSKEEIVELAKVMGEVFILGGHNLRDVAKFPIKWGLEKE